MQFFVYTIQSSSSMAHTFETPDVNARFNINRATNKTSEMFCTIVRLESNRNKKMQRKHRSRKLDAIYTKVRILCHSCATCRSRTTRKGLCFWLSILGIILIHLFQSKLIFRTQVKGNWKFTGVQLMQNYKKLPGLTILSLTCLAQTVQAVFTYHVTCLILGSEVYMVKMNRIQPGHNCLDLQLKPQTWVQLVWVNSHSGSTLTTPRQPCLKPPSSIKAWV